MRKPTRLRAKKQSLTDQVLLAAKAMAIRTYGRPVTGEDPYITALLVDMDRGDGKRTECERVAAQLGLRTGLAIMAPRCPSETMER
jgi:hypothetical protein